MGDTIKRSDARRFFTEFLSLNRFADFKNANIERLVSILCERIPSAEKQGKWIPCGERLPSDGELCLVSVIMDDAPYEIIISDSVTYCYERGWANAWMPLPEPWKGADDDAD